VALQKYWWRCYSAQRLICTDGDGGKILLGSRSNHPTAFCTNDTERMRINSSGNVGIGTTTPYSKLHTTGSLTVNDKIYLQRNSSSLILPIASYWDGSGSPLSGAKGDIVAIGNAGGDGLVFANSNLERMRIDSSGNVGIGTSSPSTKLHISGGDPSIRLTPSSTNDARIDFTDNTGTVRWYTGFDESSGNYVVAADEGGFSSSNIVAVNDSGNVLVGASSFASYGKLNSYSNTGAASGRFVGGPSMPDTSVALMVDKYSTTNTTSQWFVGFTINNMGTASGVITANGASQAAFGTWSDRRLKENVVDLPPQLENICALRPVEFDYIESEGGGHQINFIAQEFEEVYPDAVGERPDGMKTIAGWSKTEARLVKAIQEQQAMIEELKAEVAALKGA
jgi:trimeric autotransporter adhesin